MLSFGALTRVKKKAKAWKEKIKEKATDAADTLSSLLFTTLYEADAFDGCMDAQPVMILQKPPSLHGLESHSCVVLLQFHGRLELVSALAAYMAAMADAERYLTDEAMHAFLRHEKWFGLAGRDATSVARGAYAAHAALKKEAADRERREFDGMTGGFPAHKPAVAAPGDPPVPIARPGTAHAARAVATAGAAAPSFQERDAARDAAAAALTDGAVLGGTTVLDLPAVHSRAQAACSEAGRAVARFMEVVDGFAATSVAHAAGVRRFEATVAATVRSRFPTAGAQSRRRAIAVQLLRELDTNAVTPEIRDAVRRRRTYSELHARARRARRRLAAAVPAHGGHRAQQLRRRGPGRRGRAGPVAVRRGRRRLGAARARRARGGPYFLFFWGGCLPYARRRSSKDGGARCVGVWVC